MTQQTLVEAQGVCVRFAGVTVLEDVDFSIASSDIVTIVGPNGSGKSTMLRVLIGAQPLSKGSVTRKPGLRIGYVPQRLQLEKTMPLKVGRFLQLPGRASSAVIHEAAERTGIVRLLERQMNALSGGQIQRVLLAKALMNQPELLVLDEATQGLDQNGSADFYQQIESVRDELACAVLMVSHELHVVMGASDRVICLNGHICCEGTPAVVSSRPEYRALFGTGTKGVLALYQHDHDHSHSHDH